MFFNVKIPGFLWDAHLRETMETIKREPDSSSGMCLREFHRLLYNGQHPYHFPVYGFKDSVSSFSIKQIEHAFKSHRDSAHWVVSTVSADASAKISPLVSPLFSAFKIKRAPLTPQNQLTQPLSRVSHQDVDREQVHIALGYPGFRWQSKERLALDVLSSLLGGQGGRLFLRLRDEESLAYTVSPYSSFGIEGGYFAGYIASASEKFEQAKNGLRREFKLLCQEEISAEELSRAKSYVIGGHEQEIQRSDSRATTMALMELYELGFEEFLSYSDKISEIKSEDLRDVSKKLFNDSEEICSSVGRPLS